MSKGIFERRDNESLTQWVLRLHVDPWFEDCTPQELADFTGAPLKKVRGAVYSWAKSRKVRRIHQHATAVVERTGFPGTPEALVHLALERYAQRFEGRQMEPYDLDEDIRLFLLEHTSDQAIDSAGARRAYSRREPGSRAS